MPGTAGEQQPDTEPAFAEEHRERAFASFFTTKPPGGGTGLGVSSTNGIVVDSHHGDISIESELARMVFRVVHPTTIED
jgi:two-component system, NtrC family, sensor kinase